MGIYDHIVATGETILKYIPQRAPMIMVENLHLAEGGKTISSLKIAENNIFCKNNVLHEPGLIENIAQTAAVGVGFSYSKENKTIPTGYIGAVQKLSIYDLPKIGKTIFTEVIVEHEVFNTTLISGKTTCDNEIIVECKMKIFLNEN